MGLKDDDVKDMEPVSSADSADVKADADKSTAPEATSSPATDDSKEGLLSVVRDVVDERKPPKETAPSTEGAEAGEEAGDQTPKPDAENYSDVPFNKHPRFRQLLNERNSFRDDAGRYRNVETFLSDNGLASEEAAEALMVAGLAKTDPRTAWERVKPWVQKLLLAAGEVLPDDLQQRVTAGELSVEAAKEVSRSRATVNSVQVQRTFQEQQAQRRQQQEAAQSLTRAAQDWEDGRRRNDPNFDAKLVPLQKEIAYLHATEGRPKDAEGVKDQLKRAYKAVNDQIASVTPTAPAQQRRPAIRPVMGGQVAGDVRAEPRSTLDIVRAARRTG